MGFTGILLHKLSTANEQDQRGVTYEWCKGLPGLQVTIYQRKKGSICGNHFHKGDDPSKNPERFFLVQGTMRLKAWNLHGEHMNCLVEAGTEMILEPNVLHSLEAQTDVTYIEYRSTVFNKAKPDCYPAELFPFNEQKM